jgi:hypothetical protein
VTQVPLLVAIFLVGLPLAFLGGPRHRSALCCALAFPVGLAATVLLALVLLACHVPYAHGVLVAVAAVLAGLAARRVRPDRRELTIAAASTAAFALAVTALAATNVAIMNYDSHHMVMLGRVIAHDGALGSHTTSELQNWGVFQVITQSLHTLTAEDFLYSVQPALGVSFLAIFALSLWELVGERHAALVAVVTAALFTLYGFALHLVFIHTNLGSALYLFGYVVLFWLAERDRDPAPLPVAFLMLAALALQRLETPLLALIALVATLPRTTLPHRAITPWLAGFTAVIAGWYLLLVFRVSPESRFLTPQRAGMVVVLLVGNLGVWLAAGRGLVARLYPRVPLVAAAGFALALAAAYAVRTGNMTHSTFTTKENLLGLPHWGYAWYAIGAMALATLLMPPPPRHRIFTLTIWLSFGLTMLLAAVHPYRIAYLDSANRMSVHVLPLIAVYLGMTAIRALQPQAQQQPAQPAQDRDAGDERDRGPGRRADRA